ncbi:MAG: PIN domain-containing protein [Planctomycetes bacterium]|nr:PIN domain-containing protein [Planctomycetota bacterium]
MTILVDTPVWSLAYRRKRLTVTEQAIIDELGDCVRKNRTVMIGPVRQEVLSGLTDLRRFELLRTTLRAYEDLPLVAEDFELAAVMYNRCRVAGIQGSHIDFMICAISQRYDAPIFTTDGDFKNYAQHLDIALHKPS